MHRGPGLLNPGSSYVSEFPRTILLGSTVNKNLGCLLAVSSKFVSRVGGTQTIPRSSEEGVSY